MQDDGREAPDPIDVQVASAGLVSDVLQAIAGPDRVASMLQRCTQAFVDRLGARLARVWTVDAHNAALELQASAGPITGGDGVSSEIAVGTTRIDRIAAERLPHWTNDLTNEPDLLEPEWAAQAGITAFAGYPLMSDGRLVGVLGIFSSTPFTGNTLATLEGIAEAIGRAIQRRESIIALRDEHELLETLYAIGTTLAGELEVDRLVQIVSDTLTALVGAQFGAFFYNKVDETGESYTHYTLSGVPRSAFERFPLPRNTAIFEPTFRGDAIVRLADVTADSRFGHNDPYFGMPAGHLPVRSYLAVPVTSRTGEVLGGLFFGHARPNLFTERHERIAAAIAVQAGVAIDSARQYEREHSLAVTLQRSFLPAKLPDLAGLAVAAAYYPATHADVGGDWYDAVVLPDGRLSVAVGDVVGHDLQAAVTMGQLRNALRAFTFESQGPAEALRRLDRYCKLANAGQFATAIKVFYNPVTRHTLIARAGHLPALLKRANGDVELVEQEPAPPLGFGLLMDAVIHEAELTLAPGDTLVFYSDGLVERREESIDEGLQRLVEVAGQAGPLSPDALCSFLLEGLLEPGKQMDDIAILALQAE